MSVENGLARLQSQGCTEMHALPAIFDWSLDYLIQEKDIEVTEHKRC